MCIILVGKVTETQHKMALEQNRDGFSLFTQEQGLIKAPTKEQVEQALGTFGIWHYRIGTSGKLNKNNIHPFEVAQGKLLLYHNGILGEGLGDLSDTAALAKTLYDLPPKTIISILQSLAQNQRFLLVDAADPTRFKLFGEWTVSAGVLMSHKMYSYAPQAISYKSAKPWRMGY